MTVVLRGSSPCLVCGYLHPVLVFGARVRKKFRASLSWGPGRCPECRHVDYSVPPRLMLREDK